MHVDSQILKHPSGSHSHSCFPAAPFKTTETVPDKIGCGSRFDLGRHWCTAKQGRESAFQSLNIQKRTPTSAIARSVLNHLVDLTQYCPKRPRRPA